MIILVFVSLLVTLVSSAPGYDLHGLDFYPSEPLLSAPVHAPILAPAPIIKSPILAPAPLPIFAPAPIIKAAPLPILAPAPIIKAAPIIKTFAPAPIIKTFAPATSYASITQYHVAHPVVKTIVAEPAPVIKTFASLPYDGHGYGYH